MNLYIQKLKEQLSETMPGYAEADINSVLEMLYSVYRERKGKDTEEIERHFSQLDEVLSKLTLKEYDKVWYAACGLCGLYEKEAFLEGIRVGASLAVELGEKKSKPPGDSRRLAKEERIMKKLSKINCPVPGIRRDPWARRGG